MLEGNESDGSGSETLELADAVVDSPVPTTSVAVDLLPTSNTDGTTNQKSSTLTAKTVHGKETGKRNKKRRSTKAEKEKVAMDKAVTKLRSTGEGYLQAVDRLHHWLLENHQRVNDLLTKFNSEGLTKVTYVQFKAALRDLSIPCSSVELHLVCKLLDRDQRDVIDYKHLSNGFSYIWNNETYHQTPLDIEPSLHLSQRKYSHCSRATSIYGCKLAQWNGESYKVASPRYSKIHFRLLSFDQFREHVGHFTDVLPTHTTVRHTMQLVCDRTTIPTSRMVIFADKSRDAKSVLPVELTLEECGIEGGSSISPKERVLYYDYDVEFKDCPLLLCDHYLGYKSRGLALPAQSTRDGPISKV